MKALILLADNVYLTPYIKFYLSILDKMNFNYEIIYWDKNNNEVINDDKYIRFFYRNLTRKDKIIGYLKYRRFIINEIKNNNYNIIIPLHGIVSFILFDIFIFKFKYRYLYDVRDYSYEKFFLYRFVQRRLVENSIINIISSKGYEEFLPKGEYFVTHNIPNDNYQNYKQLKNSDSPTISISYIGLIRFMEQNKKIILFFKNDDRFHLNFIGTNATKLKDFCEKNDVHNVTLIDTFDPSNTLNYYRNTDLIMNLYGNKMPLLDYALSNKLYYSACLYKPILVCEGTYMEKVSSEFQIGFKLLMNSEQEKDELYKYILELDRKKLIHNCDTFMENVYKDEVKLEVELTKRLQIIKEKL